MYINVWRFFFSTSLLTSWASYWLWGESVLSHSERAASTLISCVCRGQCGQWQTVTVKMSLLFFFDRNKQWCGEHGWVVDVRWERIRSLHARWHSPLTAARTPAFPTDPLGQARAVAFPTDPLGQVLTVVCKLLTELENITEGKQNTWTLFFYLPCYLPCFINLFCIYGTDGWYVFYWGNVCKSCLHLSFLCTTLGLTMVDLYSLKLKLNVVLNCYGSCWSSQCV